VGFGVSGQVRSARTLLAQPGDIPGRRIPEEAAVLAAELRRTQVAHAETLPQEETVPAAIPVFFKNVTIAGGPAPVRAYIEELMPDVLEGRIQPGRVFDRVTGLDGMPNGYREMNDREAIKVMIDFP
jgi:threonine dehydrogenase-like Zn-dependent dehydrogenase